jgi:membrane-bound lytic murein transglycosylase MltF
MASRSIFAIGWTILLCASTFGVEAGETPAAPPEVGETAAAEDDTLAAPTKGDDALEAMLQFVNQPWKGDLDGMLKRGLIRALVVNSKTMYFSDKGRQRGISFELLSTFQDHINKKYPPSIKHIKTYVAFVPVSGDQLIPALLEGRGDIAAAATTITPERQKLVDFSEPFFRSIDEIVVTGPGSPELKALEDLAGQTVFVRPSTSYWEHLERLNERFKEEGKQPVDLDAAPEELDDEDLMEMINAGLSGIIIVDNYKAELWAKIFPNIVLHPEIVINAGGEIGWMFRKESPKLKEEVDVFAKKYGEGTSVGNTLVRRYVDSTKFVKAATSPKEMEKFEKLVGLFRKYADKYELDYLLMMAQGYQESRLDQNAKSRVGALGVMQLMPATGKQMKTGNIRELEPNIHAGVKYTRHVIDHYFKDEPIDDLNRTLFAFASYNAGPGRVRGLRKATKEAGLDPNVWFNNVELLAAKKIGSETVTYVSNIFKYYVAYKLVQEEEEARRKKKDSLQGGG